MAFSIGGINVERHILAPKITDKYRARSVEYSLNGTALEDRLGGTKKELEISLGVTPQSVWESLKKVLTEKTISVSGYVGGLDISGTYRLSDDDIPTPILYVDGSSYVCEPLSFTLEEV